MFDSLRRPWRAYRELDGLSDTECRGLIERRWLRSPPPVGVAWSVAIPVGLVSALVGPVSIDYACTLLLGEGWRGRVPGPLGFTGAEALLAFSSVGGGLLGGWATMQLAWSIWARRAIRRIVLGATCPRCGHSLVGLPIFDDAMRPDDRSRMRVRCPECGKRVRLLKHGYGPQDLAPSHERFLPKDFKVRLREHE